MTFLKLIEFMWGIIARAIIGFSTTSFYKDLTMIDGENFRRQGAAILISNHNNLYLDGSMHMSLCPRHSRILSAAVACRKPISGHLIVGSGGIPIARAIDHAVQGPGKIIKISGNKIFGKLTQFKKLSTEESLQIIKFQYRIKEIVSDTEIITSTILKDFQKEANYNIVPKLTFEEIYNYVWKGLRDGQMIGVFPQGRSKNTFTLLPLKAGFCIMALGAIEKYGIPLKIVPSCIFHDFPQKFRSKAYMQFGKAFQVSAELVNLYKENKSQAIKQLKQKSEQLLLFLFSC